MATWLRYIGRSDHAWHARPDAHGCQRPPSEYLRQILFDTIVYRPEQLRHLIAEAGVSQIVVGTDYPYDMAHYDMHALLDALPELSRGRAGRDSRRQRRAAAGTDGACMSLHYRLP